MLARALLAQNVSESLSAPVLLALVIIRSPRSTGSLKGVLRLACQGVVLCVLACTCLETSSYPMLLSYCSYLFSINKSLRTGSLRELADLPARWSVAGLLMNMPE